MCPLPKPAVQRDGGERPTGPGQQATRPVPQGPSPHSGFMTTWIQPTRATQVKH